MQNVIGVDAANADLRHTTQETVCQEADGGKAQCKEEAPALAGQMIDIIKTTYTSCRGTDKRPVVDVSIKDDSGETFGASYEVSSDIGIEDAIRDAVITGIIQSKMLK